MSVVLEAQTKATSPYLNTASWTFSHTHVDGRALLVAFTMQTFSNATGAPTSITFNGVAADEIVTGTVAGMIWGWAYWSDPGSVTANVVLTFDTNIRQIGAFLLQLSGAAGLGAYNDYGSTVWQSSATVALSAEEVGSYIAVMYASQNDTTTPSIGSPATQLDTFVNTSASKNVRAALGYHVSTTTDSTDYSGTSANSYINMSVLEVLAASEEEVVSAENVTLTHTVSDIGYIEPITFQCGPVNVSHTSIAVAFEDAVSISETVLATTLSDISFVEQVIQELDVGSATLLHDATVACFCPSYALSNGVQNIDRNYTVVLSGKINDIRAA